MLIVDSVIQSNGQKNNVKKRSQLCVLACDILGPIAVPDSLPSLPHWISTSGQIACEIVSQASQLCITKGRHPLRCSSQQKSQNVPIFRFKITQEDISRDYLRKIIMVYDFPQFKNRRFPLTTLHHLFLTKWRRQRRGNSYHSRKTIQKKKKTTTNLVS